MILAINTAFIAANLALSTEDGKTHLKDLNAECKHSENVLKTIDELCQEAKVDILNVDTIAVVTGPGSFTGLRIGTAVGKALGCVSKNTKFISLSSLELMAYIVVKKKLCHREFVCVLNALSDLFFVAYFDCNGIKLKEEKMIDKQEYLQIKETKFSLIGDLADKECFEIEIDSECLMEFAKMKENLNEFCTVDQLVPKYLRLSQAEDNLLKKKKKD